MVLHILDTSNYIYAGSAYSTSWIARGVRETNGSYSANEAPIGGVKCLLNNVFRLTGPNSVVMPVFDATPTIKREMYADAFGDPYGYKGNRKKNKTNVAGQKDYARVILEDMGYPVQYATDYEADDLIYTIVQMYRDDYDHIYIHTQDSDLFFLVDEKVTIAPTGEEKRFGTRGKTITVENYTTTVVKDKLTIYNGIHLMKLGKGDTSDNIPGIGMKWLEELDKVLKPEDYPKLGDLDLCRKLLRELVMNHPELPGGHKVIPTFNIIVPLKVPVDLINDAEPIIDEFKMQYYKGDWCASIDTWGLEDLLAEYIDSYYS